MELSERLKRIRLLCMDCDGVLTDGHLYWSEAGFWQRFSVRDGYGLKMLETAGVELAILSGGDVRSARERAAGLGITHAYFGIEDKVAAWRDVAGALGVSAEETAYIGDELVDLPLLELAGVSATVPDAPDEVKRAVHYVTTRPGGDGAVRELCDMIRRARGA